jgi:hypothetical protein
VIFHVGFRIGKVEFGVRHVEIAAEDHRLFLFKFFEIAKKLAVPLLAIR